MIEERMTGWGYVRKLKLEGVRVLEAPVNQVLLFHYLHKKNRDLVPKLDVVFRAMNQEGVLNKIMKQYKNRTN